MHRIGKQRILTDLARARLGNDTRPDIVVMVVTKTVTPYVIVQYLRIICCEDIIEDPRPRVVRDNVVHYRVCRVRRWNQRMQMSNRIQEQRYAGCC